MAYGKINVESAVSGGSGLPAQLVNYTMLYDSGDECTDVTGGWDYYPSPQQFNYTVNNNAVKNADHLYFPTQGTRTYSCYLYTKNKFAVSDGYSKLGMLAVSLAKGSFTESGYCVLSANTSKYISERIGGLDIRFSNADTALSCKTLDISSVSEDFYVLIGTCNDRSFSAYNCFLVKEDNWQEWISKAGLSTDTYTTLDAVIADSTALTTLMNNEAAVKYMLLNCTGTVIASVIQSDTALDIIRDSDYNATIFENEHWNKFLRMVGEVPSGEKTYLYNEGDENTDYGGMTFPTLATTANSSFDSYHTKHGVTGSVVRTKNSDNISIKIVGYPQSSNVGSVYIDKPVNLSKYSKIKIDCMVNTNPRGIVLLGVFSSKPDGMGIYENRIAYKTIAAQTTLSRTVLEFDISEVIDLGYITAYGIIYDKASNNNAVSTTTEFYIYRIWLE